MNPCCLLCSSCCLSYWNKSRILLHACCLWIWTHKDSWLNILKFTSKLFLLLLCVQQAPFWLELGSLYSLNLGGSMLSKGLQHLDHLPRVSQCEWGDHCGPLINFNEVMWCEPGFGRPVYLKVLMSRVCKVRVMHCGKSTRQCHPSDLWLLASLPLGTARHHYTLSLFF